MRAVWKAARIWLAVPEAWTYRWFAGRAAMRSPCARRYPLMDATLAGPGANRLRYWAGVRKCRYRVLRGSETSVANRSAAAACGWRRYTVTVSCWPAGAAPVAL